MGEGVKNLKNVNFTLRPQDLDVPVLLTATMTLIPFS